MKPISFCIASAVHEKEYTKLLIRSLIDHTDFNSHEVLIFIDSDNQNTYEMLLEIKKNYPNLRICKNPNEKPIGSQRNVSVMFNAATNDIVCYLQSDMVVGKDFDRHINESIDESTVLSCARIEPPLHPASPEKIVMDFGITPEEFKYQEFVSFVKKLQSENRPNMRGHFAPFAVYKKAWFDKLGGFDTQFRSSREDSDTIIRMEMAGLKMIQTWNACVYHFTCVSSRGHDWYKTTEAAKYKNELQSLADHQELKKFIRKWGFFGHDPKPVYNIAFSVEIDRYVDFNLLKYIEPYCSKLYLSDGAVVKQLVDQLEFDTHYYNNLRWNYTFEYWQKCKHLFNAPDFSKRVVFGKAESEDVIISFKYSELLSNLTTEIRSVLENANQIVDQNEPGKFYFGPLTIEIKAKNDSSKDKIKVKNTDLLLNDQELIFT